VDNRIALACLAVQGSATVWPRIRWHARACGWGALLPGPDTFCLLPPWPGSAARRDSSAILGTDRGELPQQHNKIFSAQMFI